MLPGSDEKRITKRDLTQSHTEKVGREEEAVAIATGFHTSHLTPLLKLLSEAWYNI